jgi:hypothetical protein
MQIIHPRRRGGRRTEREDGLPPGGQPILLTQGRRPICDSLDALLELAELRGVSMERRRSFDGCAAIDPPGNRY